MAGRGRGGEGLRRVWRHSLHIPALETGRVEGQSAWAVLGALSREKCARLAGSLLVRATCGLGLISCRAEAAATRLHRRPITMPQA